jgi:alkyldihydroxyacetonephosphate synthase
MFKLWIENFQDKFLDFKISTGSFETSVCWDKCFLLSKNVQQVMLEEGKKVGIKELQTTCRVSQIYDAGVCVYFYVGFKYEDQDDPTRIYDKILKRAKDEILASGRFGQTSDLSYKAIIIFFSF